MRIPSGLAAIPFLATLGLMLAACTGPSATATPTATSRPSPTSGPTVVHTPTPTPLPTPTPVQLPTPTHIATTAPIPTPSPTPQPLPSTDVGAPTATAAAESISKPAISPTITAAPMPTAVFQPPAEPLRSARIIVSDDSLWAGHHASRTVTRLKLPGGQRVWQTSIWCEPATLSRAEPILFVACFDSGELLVLHERTGEVLTRKWVGHGAFGVLAVSERTYVTLAHENALVVLRHDSLAEIARVSVGRQPRGLAMLDNRLYVVHLLDAASRIFDAETMVEVGGVRIGLQGALGESVTLHPDRKRAYIPHQREINRSDTGRLSARYSTQGDRRQPRDRNRWMRAYSPIFTSSHLSGFRL